MQKKIISYFVGAPLAGALGGIANHHAVIALQADAIETKPVNHRQNRDTRKGYPYTAQSRIRGPGRLFSRETRLFRNGFACCSFYMMFYINN
ncbi:MAG: hypothetical protein V1791_13795 [Pseudomonadota bacterium]